MLKGTHCSSKHTVLYSAAIEFMRTFWNVMVSAYICHKMWYDLKTRVLTNIMFLMRLIFHVFIENNYKKNIKPRTSDLRNGFGGVEWSYSDQKHTRRIFLCEPCLTKMSFQKIYNKELYIYTKWGVAAYSFLLHVRKRASLTLHSGFVDRWS